MKTDPFILNIIFLIITGLFSGLLIPWILKKIETNKERLNAQSSLIDDLTKTLWNWRYLSKKVVYYASTGDAKYQDAKQEYEVRIWDLLTNLRIQTSKARRLLSEKSYAEFEKFYQYISADIDQQVTTLIAKENDKKYFEETASELSDRFSTEVSKSIDDILKKVSDELS